MTTGTASAASAVLSEMTDLLTQVAELSTATTIHLDGLDQTNVNAALVQATEVLAQVNAAPQSNTVTLELHFVADENDKKERPLRTIILSADDHEKYNFQPSYLPKAINPSINELFEGPNEDDIIFLNAQNTAYYCRVPEKPVATVWLLLGGESEKDGEIVYKHTTKRLFEEAFKLNIYMRVMLSSKFGLIVNNDMAHGMLYEGEFVPYPDLAISRFGATISYDGLLILRQLDLMEIPMMNGVESVEISRDKMYTHQILAREGLPIPKNVLGKIPTSSDKVSLQVFSKHLDFPMIVKGLSGSQGEAVWKVDSVDDLMRQAPEINKSVGGKNVVFQSFIAPSSGRDLRIIVANGKIVCAMMRIASTGFKANFHQGGKVKKVNISPELAEMAIKCTRVCKLDIAGVDVLMDKENYVICEINSSPGFEGMERASRVNVAKEFCQAALDKINFAKMSARLIYKFREPSTVKNVPIQIDHLI
jgi:gamma-F420-2:alpha-L-glutamate ligase